MNSQELYFKNVAAQEKGIAAAVNRMDDHVDMLSFSNGMLFLFILCVCIWFDLIYFKCMYHIHISLSYRLVVYLKSKKEKIKFLSKAAAVDLIGF